MKWVAISGSQHTSSLMEQDVRETVSRILMRGDGIVIGGALGVDSFALEEALIHDPSATYIKVCLPATLSRYGAHYRMRAQEGVITHGQAEDLISLLTRLKRTNPRALIEHPTNEHMNQEIYYAHNTQIVEFSDELYAFQANESAGTQDAIDKAQAKNIPVILHSYSLH